MVIKRVTLKDIADASGYSLVSVHRALNNKEGVSRKTRSEIIAVAEELGYTTNYVASALKRRPVNIAIVLPGPEESGKYYFRYIWKGCSDARDEVLGYNLNVMEYTFSVENSNSNEEQLTILQSIYDEWGDSLDGLLTLPCINSFPIQCLLSRFSGRGVAVVLIDEDFTDCGRLCCISPNDVYTGRSAAELMSLVIAGREGTILVAQGDERSLAHTMNAEGFEGYLKEHDPQIRITSIEDSDDLKDKQSRILKEFNEDPTIIGAYSTRARNTIPMCNALIGSERKDEIFMIGSDLFEESAQMLRDGVLKGIVYKNPYQKGYTGFMTLFEYLIKGVDPRSEAISVPISIILANNLQFFEDFI